MVFENEINIYDPNAIANEFHTQSTQISAVQGKISAMISDSQLQELMDGRVNMYDRLVSAEMDITGITTQVSELRQADGELTSQISTIRQTASSISAEVSQVKDNYAQKAQLILAINHVTQESETVINASHISLAGKTIELTSDNISINSTYFKVNKNGEITATKGTFSGSLNAATGTFSGNLSAAGGTFKGALQAATGTFSGNLSAAGGTFKGSLSAATGTFSGNLSAAGGTFKGALQAATGTFAGTLSASCIQGGTLKLGGSSNTNGALAVYNASSVKVIDINNAGVHIANTPRSGRHVTNVSTSLNAEGVVSSGTYKYGSGPSTPIKIYVSTGEINYTSNNKSLIVETMWSGSPSYTGDNSIYHCLNLGRPLIVTGNGGYAFDSAGSDYVTKYASAPYTWSSRDIYFQVFRCAFMNQVSVGGNFKVYGNDKSRVVRTDDYGYRALYSYEAASPMFGDVGSGVIGEDGIAIVDIDDLLLETIATSIEYHVFLQKEGGGDLWVSDKKPNYFVIEGTPGLKFSWELKAIQKENETKRIEDDIISTNSEIENQENPDIYDVYKDELESLLAEQEGVLYDNQAA